MTNSIRNASVTVILAHPHNIPLKDNGCYGVLCEFNTLLFNVAKIKVLTLRSLNRQNVTQKIFFLQIFSP